MDHFGIGTAIKAQTITYFQLARATGRTMMMVADVKDDDRIIFTNHEEANRVQRLLSHRDCRAVCTVIDPIREFHKLSDLHAARGRTIFDHTWIEQYYLHVIGVANREIDHIEKSLSGDEAKETARQRRENTCWRREGTLK